MKEDCGHSTLEQIGIYTSKCCGCGAIIDIRTKDVIEKKTEKKILK